MGSDGVVLPPPLFGEHFRLLQRVEDLPLQDFFAQRPVEAVAILPAFLSLVSVTPCRVGLREGDTQCLRNLLPSMDC